MIISGFYTDVITWGVSARYPKIHIFFELHDYLLLFHVILLEESYQQIWQLLRCHDQLIAHTKYKLRSAFAQYNDRSKLIGGLGIVVEVDETLLCRRGILRNPTHTDDNCPGTTRILGVIERTPARQFYVVRVPDRTINFITQALVGIVSVGSILYSDGHPSYPQVASNLGLVHHWVNHSQEFVNEEGTYK